MARGYGEPVGNEYGADENRERWRDDDRERSSWRSGDRDRGEDRGFFERAGEEIRSWFSDEDDDDRRPGGDWDRGRSRGSSSWDRDSDRSSRSHGGGWSGGGSWDRQREGGMSDRDRERSYGRMGRGSDPMSEDRSSFGGMAQGGMGRSGGSSWDRGQDRGHGPSRGGYWTESSSGDRSRMGFGGRGASRSDREWEHGGHARSMSEANRRRSPGWTSDWDRDEDRNRGSLGYEDMGGTLGGFGNQRFGSGQDDHYLSWRNKQLEQLDRDYEEYCRDCEQKFHSDFDSWRRNRQSQQGQPAPGSQGTTGSQGTSDELILGSSSTSNRTGSAGTGGATGTAGESSAVGGDSLAASSPTASDADETPAGGSGSGVSGRSRTRS